MYQSRLVSGTPRGTSLFPPSAARDGGVRVADRDVRPGEGVSGALRAGLQAAPGGGYDLGPDLHYRVHAV